MVGLKFLATAPTGPFPMPDRPSARSRFPQSCVSRPWPLAPGPAAAHSLPPALHKLGPAQPRHPRSSLPPVQLPPCRDENEHKRTGKLLSRFCLYIFTGNRTENGKMGSEMKMVYADIRKRINMDKKLEN